MPSLPQHASEELPDDDAGGLVGCLLVTAIEQPKRVQHDHDSDHAPTDDNHLAVTRMSQSAPRRKRAERAVRKIESEMRSPPLTPRGRLSPLLSP